MSSASAHWRVSRASRRPTASRTQVVGPRVRGGFRGHRRLAEAGVARQQDHLPTAGDRRATAVVELSEHILPADEAPPRCTAWLPWGG